MPSQSESEGKSARAPGVERRRQLRQQRRRELFIQSWRVLFFCTVSAGLGWLLLSQGWMLSSQDQIKVRGSAHLGKDAVIQAGEISLPIPLLEFQPNHLQKNLLQKLPVKSVDVSRRLLPAALVVQLQDRKPIAYGIRQNSNGTEKGMVDEKGHWMALTVANQGELPKNSIQVLGWRPTHQKLIAQVLELRADLGSPLLKILIAPDGELSIQTKALGVIELGMNPEKLGSQLNAVAHLSRTLPADYRNKKGTLIDLTNPGQPELQVTKPAKPKQCLKNRDC